MMAARTEARSAVACTARAASQSTSRLEKRRSRSVRTTTSCDSPTNSVASRNSVRRRLRPALRVASGWATKSAAYNTHAGCASRAGINARRAPAPCQSVVVRLGTATCSIDFSSSCFTRSRERRDRNGALSTIAAQVAGSIRKPKRPAKRSARRARKRSSTMRSRACPTARTTPCERSSRPLNGSCSRSVDGEYAIALIVKSRRARSSSSEAPNSTTACRPSVCTSRRKVVTSCRRPCRSSTPIVPNCSPTGIVRRKVRLTCGGVADVARSQSR